MKEVSLIIIHTVPFVLLTLFTANQKTDMTAVIIFSSFILIYYAKHQGDITLWRGAAYITSAYITSFCINLLHILVTPFNHADYHTTSFFLAVTTFSMTFIYVLVTIFTKRTFIQ